jgi:DNA-binding response OmpR family regulator
MRVLIAEDDAVTRRSLSALVAGLGHDVSEAADGRAAWARLRAEPHDVLLSDWMMPEMDGPELCRLVKGPEHAGFCYVIMLTVKGEAADVVAGIMAGADDFMTKPADHEVLQARLHAAQRVVELERRLAAQVEELERALAEVRTLRGLLPVCMYCHNVRRGDEMWEDVLAYIRQRSEADFSHTICPDCYERHVKPMLGRAAERGRRTGQDWR